MINNRQAGRRRGRGGGNNNGGGGPRQGGQGNGSRIDSRARGNATQLHEKYKNMASDAQRAGDRVSTEYYLQFADHYFRVLSEQRGRFEDQPRARNRDDFDDDGDADDAAGEFGEEGEPIRAGEQASDGRGEQGREYGRDGNRDQGRDDRAPRDDRYGNGDGRGREANGDGRPRAERDGNRDAGRDTGRDGGQREFRRDRNDGDNRAERPRGDWQDRPDNREPRRERRPEPQLQPQVGGEVAGQRRADPPQPGESLDQRAEDVLAADRPLDAPARRRGRPPRAVAAVEAIGEPAVIGADRLPPSLSASLGVAANDEDGDEPKPRRRRARPADDTPTAAE